MSARRLEAENYREAERLIGTIREEVADQLHDLVVERAGVSSYDEFAESVRQVGRVAQQLAQARGRKKQAREMGLPLAKPTSDEREALDLLRQSIMSAAATGAGWVVAFDFEARQHELMPERANGRPEDTI